MKKTNNCKHRFIGKKIDSEAMSEKVLIECFKCRKMLYSDQAFDTVTFSGKSVSVCRTCKPRMKCHECGTTLNRLKTGVLAECIDCAKIAFFCDKCGKNIMSMPEYSEEFGYMMRKFQSVLKKILPNLDEMMPKDIAKPKDLKGFGAPVIFYLNFIMPHFDYEEDDDGYFE